MARDWRIGDHLVTDDRTGLVIWASDSRKEWTGSIVSKDVFEQRHPQDLIRSRRDDMSVPDPRPRPLDRFVGPLTTKIAVAAVPGDQTIEVESSVRMEPGDRLSIMLDNADTFRVLVLSLPDATHIELVSKMPGSARQGMFVYDNTAMSPATLP